MLKGAAIKQSDCKVLKLTIIIARLDKNGLRKMCVSGKCQDKIRDYLNGV